MESKQRTEGDSNRYEAFGVMLPANANIRRVNFSDLEAIMAINDDIYEGLDYMPSLFYTFLHSKQHEMYVYEEDGKVLSLANFQFPLGENVRVNLMSGRVHPSYQNHGLSRLVMLPLVKNHPEVVKYFASTLYKPFLQDKVNDFESVYITNFLLYKLSDRSKIERFVLHKRKMDGFSEPTAISHSKLTSMLYSSDQLLRFVSRYSKTFIPLGPTWGPIRVSGEGLRHISSFANVFVTYAESGPSAGFEPSHSRARANKEKQVTGFSYSITTPCKYGSRSDFVFYGDDAGPLMSHFVSHLRHQLSITRDDVGIACLVQFPRSISVQEVEEKLKEEVGASVRTEYFSVTQTIHYCGNLAQAKL